MINYQQKIGRFFIPRSEITNRPQAVKDVFRFLDAIVIKAQIAFHRDAIEYQGLSEHFDPIGYDQEIPEYQITLHPDKVTVERVDKPKVSPELLDFLFRLAKSGGRIVSTNDLTVFDIASARAEGRMFVDNDGFGYVYLPKSNVVPFTK